MTDPSWIIVAEGNEFIWPGYDLRKLLHSDRYDYGFLPPRFFNQVLRPFANWYRSSRRRVSPREWYGETVPTQRFLRYSGANGTKT